jgi:hypothetical protein
MEGLIRKIVIGRDPKEAMAYYVGMRAGDGKISTILLDERYRYMQNADESQVLWKAVTDMPCIVEYDCNF